MIESGSFAHGFLRAFGFLQGIFLLAIVVAVVVYRRREREREEAMRIKMEQDGLNFRPNRSNLSQSQDQSHREEPQYKEAPAQLESAFPNWTKDTPPHEILGIPPQADEAAVEAAYKSLLKKYHPDRMAHWGQGYQQRAHYVVLMIQEARDRLLGKSRR